MPMLGRKEQLESNFYTPPSGRLRLSYMLLFHEHTYVCTYVGFLANPQSTTLHAMHQLPAFASRHLLESSLLTRRLKPSVPES
jgi:hypothetical protein